MPRRVTIGSAGLIFHVLNRGVRKARLFDDAGDYDAFLDIVVEALARHPVEILAYCVMSNHFHFLIRPRRDGQLSQFMQWMTLTHSKRWHRHRGTNGTGCVYQGRFKAFPVQDDVHFLTVARYVERNALRANLVSTAEDWPWCSAHQRSYDVPWIPISRWPVREPDDWPVLLNTTDPGAELARIRRCIARSRPYGSTEWTDRMVERLVLSKSVNPIGRPGKRNRESFYENRKTTPDFFSLVTDPDLVAAEVGIGAGRRY